MQINDICEEIKRNGFKNLGDDDIQRYIEYQRELALDSADFQAQCRQREAELKAVSDAQMKIADSAIDAFTALCAAPLNLRRVGDGA